MATLPSPAIACSPLASPVPKTSGVSSPGNVIQIIPLLSRDAMAREAGL